METNKKKIFFLSENKFGCSLLVQSLQSEFEVTCFNDCLTMLDLVEPGKVPDMFIIDYSHTGYTAGMSAAVRSLRKIDRTAIIFALYSKLDNTDGEQALLDGCTDIINHLSVDYIVKKSTMLCKAKTEITRRIRRTAHAM